jgi:hypothetical protein
MGWVLKVSRQKLVVCRYEEEPARGVSLVVKQQFHGGETYSGRVLRESSLYIILSVCFLVHMKRDNFGGILAGSSESLLCVLFSLRVFLFIRNVTIRRYRYVATQMMYIRLNTFSVSFCFSAPPKFMIFLKTLYTDKVPPPSL